MKRRIEDSYTAATLADARAVARQAMDTMIEDGFDIARIHAARAADGYAITVTYEAADMPDCPEVNRVIAELGP